MTTFKQFLLQEDPSPWLQVDMDARIPMSVVNKSRDLRKSPRNQLLGTGANSFVYRDEDDNQNLDTVSRVGGAEDYSDQGYRAYVEFIHSHPKLKNNPYLPRVHSIDAKDDTQKYDIERLHPYDSEKISSAEILWATAEKAFTDHVMERMRKGAEATPDEKEVIKDLQFDIVYTIRNCIGRNWVSTSHYMAMAKKYIKDPMLIQALQVINYLLKYNRQMSMDLHQGNVMWRITGNMPQLVLTDPLY